VSGTTQSMPISVALVAGALVALNPCSFPLLPAFLSYYLCVDAERLPRARSGLRQELIVGPLLTLGVVAVFTSVGLPLSRRQAAGVCDLDAGARRRPPWSL
jgi:cytochrome c biogenesis protein CcdA